MNSGSGVNVALWLKEMQLEYPLLLNMKTTMLRF